MLTLANKDKNNSYKSKPKPQTEETNNKSLKICLKNCVNN